MENLELEIKQLIIESLNLEGMSVDDIQTNAPLFNDGLGLDSIDALELGIAIKQKFNVHIAADNEQMRAHFFSVKTLADFIKSNTQK